MASAIDRSGAERTRVSRAFEGSRPGLWLVSAALVAGILAGCGARTTTTETGSSRRTNIADETDVPARVRGTDPARTTGPTANRRELNFVGQRLTVGLNPTTSIECYTFFPDAATVELRHNGLLTPTDSGTYRGDESTGWHITWGSGRASTVAATGDDLVINGLKVTEIQSCRNR